jgi:hypothetical protein
MKLIASHITKRTRINKDLYCLQFFSLCPLCPLWLIIKYIYSVAELLFIGVFKLTNRNA